MKAWGTHRTKANKCSEHSDSIAKRVGLSGEKRSSLTEAQSVKLAFTVQYGTKPKQIKRCSGSRVTKAFVLLEHVMFFLQKLGKKYAKPKRTFDFCVLQDNLICNNHAVAPRSLTGQPGHSLSIRVWSCFRFCVLPCRLRTDQSYLLFSLSLHKILTILPFESSLYTLYNRRTVWLLLRKYKQIILQRDQANAWMVEPFFCKVCCVTRLINLMCIDFV